MSTKLRTLCYGACLLVIAMSGMGYAETYREEKISMSQVPAAVKATIEREIKGGRITEIVKKTIRGTTIYEFEVQAGGRELDYSVAADGKFIGIEGPGYPNRGEEGPQGSEVEEADDWQNAFDVSRSDLVPTGRNRFFILEPGYRLTLKGKARGEEEVVQITVLKDTRLVDGVVTRVVEEREWKNGMLVEVSRNYYAVDRKTNDVYYFGEEVDIYAEERIVAHEGAWLSGENGARFGLIMPAHPKVGFKHYQEIAPGMAMDRAEIKSLKSTMTTPSGKFRNCLNVDETSPLEPGEHSWKMYAPGVGLIKDGITKLVSHGFVK